MTTILLVDDDPLQAYLLMSLLEHRFAVVQRASDAAEAFCLVEQLDFAHDLGLVISGHHTPGIAGPAFVAELRDRMPDVPIIVLGTTGEAPGSYADPHVIFLPRHLITKQMVTLSDQLLGYAKRKVA